MFYVDKIDWPDADTETAYDSPHQTNKTKKNSQTTYKYLNGFITQVNWFILQRAETYKPCFAEQ
jgi:hypothetical protein